MRSAAPSGAGGVDLDTQIGRDWLAAKRTDVATACVAFRDKANRCFRGGTDDTQELANHFLAIALADGPAKHRNMRPDMMTGRFLAKNMGSFKVAEGARRIL